MISKNMSNFGTFNPKIAFSDPEIPLMVLFVQLNKPNQNQPKHRGIQNACEKCCGAE